mgnify:CR=1 FL=1
MNLSIKHIGLFLLGAILAAFPAFAETNYIIAEVERSIAKNNKFPANVGKLIEEHDLRTNIRFGLLHTEIKTFENNGDHFIEYFQSPFGPFAGYNFESKEWYSTE